MRYAVVLAVLVLVAACASSSPPPPEDTFCSATATAAKRCKDPSACDTTLTQRCTTLAKAVSPTTAAAAKDCLESGVCGSASCLTRAQKSAVATPAQNALATLYCTRCAPDVGDCAAQFYAPKSAQRGGPLPGALVLPYADAVATAVGDACTAEPGACRATFTACANDTIARVVPTLVDADLAQCVASAFHHDDVTTSFPAGGPEIATCTAANCNGCCRDDRCEEGASPAACGVNAAACQTCSSVQQCIAGHCHEPCGPNNCKGCCDGDNCIPGTTTAKCGGDGEACAQCDATNKDLLCAEKTCVDGSCKATCTDGCCSAAGCQPGTAAKACGNGAGVCVDCGYGRTCGTSKACSIDPAALWDFHVAFASIPDKQANGSAWDPFGGLPDAYVRAFSNLGAASHTGDSTVANDTLDPFWSEDPLVGITAAELLANTSFELWDSDPDFDDFIGGCKLPVTAAMFDDSLQSFTCSASASSVSVELYYRISPHRP